MKSFKYVQFRDFIVGKMDKSLFTQQKTEILLALVKLNVTLTKEESNFLDVNCSSSMKQFTNIQETVVIKDGLINRKN